MRYLHFADICIDTHNQLLYRQNETINLAPKVYDLLVFLCQNSHRVISKDELMEQVWSGTLVTENAISRTLVKVRKALADDPKNPQFIITVPRKGYRMVADFTASDTVSPQVLISVSTNNHDVGKAVSSVNQMADRVIKSPYSTNVIRSSDKESNVAQKYLWLIGVMIIVVIIAWRLSSGGNNVLQTKQVKALTRDVGIELYPEISPDLTQLAYSKMIPDKPSYINIEVLSNSVKRSISHARAALSKPVWSPTENKLAFLYQHNSVCIIYWADLEDIKNKESWQPISECGADSSPHFVFTPDGRKLYFNDRQSTSHGYQVFRVNLASYEKEIVNQPITNGLGNYSFDISSNGQHLIMANSEFSPNTRLYTLNIDDSTLEQTAQLNYLMRSVIWHHDNETIIHPSPHPAYELWQSNLDGNKLAVVASNTSRVKHLARVNNGKDFSFVSYLLNRDIHFKEKSGNNIALDNSTVMDYLPKLSNSGEQYAFVSKRSTTAEIYLSHLSNKSLDSSSDENTKRLSQFNNPVKLYDLAFSPKDNHLMILADNEIYLADNNSMEIKKIPLDNIALAGVSWQDEDSLLLSTIKNSDWHLMKYNIDEQALTPLLVGYQGGVYSAVDDSYYFIADESFQVMRYKDLSAEPQAIPLTCQPSIINRKLNLKITDSGLLCRTVVEINPYKHYSFKTQKSEAWQGSFFGTDFELHNKGMIYAKIKQSVSDVMQTTSL